MARQTRVWVGLLVPVLAAACDNGGANARPSTSNTGKLRAEPCSDVAASDGLLQVQEVLADQSNEPNPRYTFNTTDLVITADTTIFIVDSEENAVTHLSRDGRILGRWGRAGDGPGEFRRPSAITIGHRGRVYVASGRGRVTIFSPDGEYVASFRVPDVDRVSDLIVLPNGNVVIAIDATPQESRTAYVMIVDSTGKRVKSVAAVSASRRGGTRPLLGYQINPVRLTQSAQGDFAVWYVIDNYVEVFDSAGTSLAVVVGCLPQSILNSYERQAQRASEWQSFQKLTLGVSFDSTIDGIAVYSLMSKEGARYLRVRQYALAGVELRTRDYRIPESNIVDRIERLADGDVFAFHSSAPDRGIRRYRLQ